MSDYERHWRMWLMGTVSNEAGLPLTTVDILYRNRDSEVGQIMRDSVAALDLLNRMHPGDDEMLLTSAMMHSDYVVRRLKRKTCEVCE